ncbi:NifU-like protein involved in Fe-S cluster formation [Snodgrassella alvi SCGC AB-598-J21]|uniref:NifU-like protein involved in Fe-S cluster formation n=1 Tax=Snodgrassella alvi SCGC AB-598-J21 TaxID=1385367 RepID=A0A074W2B0_9NEIS|nr:NifU-like protein involved in Fe-S cluster formation [Snodgrassella alvi SCGC AB-598-J21]
MAYSDKVIDHYENPRNVGSFEKDMIACLNRLNRKKIYLIRHGGWKPIHA